jgi:photosystem II stability/assembly factor-like uncharacterized protein
MVMAAATVAAFGVVVPTWTLQSSGSTASLRGISVVSNQVVWASGSRGTVLRSLDGGATWQARAVPGADALDFRDVDAFSAEVAYILSIGNGGDSRIYKTRDGGATWALQFTNQEPDGFYDAMAFWDERRGIAVSDSINGQFVIIKTEDGGASWSRVSNAAIPPAQDGEGYFAASGTNVAVWGDRHVWLGTGAAERARVLRSSDAGRTWQVVDTPLGSGSTTGIFSIAFRDAMHGVVVGGNYERADEAIDNIAMTSDGGASWTLTRGPGGQPSPLSGHRSVVGYLPGTSILVAVGAAGSDISRDDGRTWTPIEGPGFFSFGASPSGTAGWAAGSQGRIARLSGF